MPAPSRAVGEQKRSDNAFLGKISSLKRFSSIRRGFPEILVESLYLEVFEDIDLALEPS